MFPQFSFVLIGAVKLIILLNIKHLLREAAEYRWTPDSLRLIQWRSADRVLNKAAVMNDSAEPHIWYLMKVEPDVLFSLSSASDEADRQSSVCVWYHADSFSTTPLEY